MGQLLKTQEKPQALMKVKLSGRKSFTLENILDILPRIAVSMPLVVELESYFRHLLARKIETENMYLLYY